jgi:hypothetical protein
MNTYTYHLQNTLLNRVKYLPEKAVQKNGTHILCSIHFSCQFHRFRDNQPQEVNS